MRLWTACALALAAWLGPAAGQLTITSTLAASPAPATPADGLTLTVTSVSAPALSSVPTPTPSPEAEPVTLTQTLTTPSPAGTDYITRTIFSTIAPAGEPPRVVTQVTVVVPNAGAPATQTVVQVSNCAATQCQDLGIVPAQCLVLNDHSDACWCSYARIKAQCLATKCGQSDAQCYVDAQASWCAVVSGAPLPTAFPDGCEREGATIIGGPGTAVVTVGSAPDSSAARRDGASLVGLALTTALSALVTLRTLARL